MQDRSSPCRACSRDADTDPNTSTTEPRMRFATHLVSRPTAAAGVNAPLRWWDVTADPWARLKCPHTSLSLSYTQERSQTAQPISSAWIFAFVQACVHLCVCVCVYMCVCLTKCLTFYELNEVDMHIMHTNTTIILNSWQGNLPCQQPVSHLVDW